MGMRFHSRPNRAPSRALYKGIASLAEIFFGRPEEIRHLAVRLWQAYLRSTVAPSADSYEFGLAGPSNVLLTPSQTYGAGFLSLRM